MSPSSAQTQVTVGDDLSSGIETEAVFTENPPSFRVAWIQWDSGFRGSGLMIEDRIVAVDGATVGSPASPADLQRNTSQSIGQYDESQRWKAVGKQDGDSTSLTVRRRALYREGWVVLEIRGMVRASRIFTAENGHRLYGPGGPDGMAYDDFPASWSSWYDGEITAKWRRILDGGWERSLSSRYELQSHLAGKPRLDYLSAHYPGQFAGAAAADWEQVRLALEGKVYSPAEVDLSYRQSQAPATVLPTPPASATPREVVEALIAAAKSGDRRLWNSLFATWRAEAFEDGHARFDEGAYAVDRLLDDTHAKLLENVCDLKIFWIDDIQPYLLGTEFPGAPKVDQVQVEMEHIGLFDGEYRVFSQPGLNRMLPLQRVNAGPWRVASDQIF